MAGPPVGRMAGVQIGANTPQSAKRSSRNGAAVCAAAAEASPGPGQLSVPGLPLLPSLGPHLQLQGSFPDRNAQWIVFALQSGVKSEVAAALNALSLLAFSEKDIPRREQALLARIPGLLDALLHLIAEWRDAQAGDASLKLVRARTLGAGRFYTGFGSAEAAALDARDPLHRLRLVQESSVTAAAPSEYPEEPQAGWWAEEGLFNLDDAARSEQQRAAVAASNVLRSLSCLPENAPLMAEHPRCLEVLFTCLLDHPTEDEELVTNSMEIIGNAAALIDMRHFSQASPEGSGPISLREEEVLQALRGMLEAPVKAWHRGAAEAVARLTLNPDNEPALVRVGPQMFERLATLLGRGDPEVQGAAVAALAAFAELGASCKLQLGRQRWVIPRLIAVIKAPHPLLEVCRRASAALESLASEFRNRDIFLAYEQQIAEIAMSENKCADHMARVLWELTSDTSSKGSVVWSVWGA